MIEWVHYLIVISSALIIGRLIYETIRFYRRLFDTSHQQQMQNYCNLKAKLHDLKAEVLVLQKGCHAYHELKQRQLNSCLHRIEKLEGFRLRTSERLDELEAQAPEPKPKKAERAKKKEEVVQVELV